jgi:hypothetical protein
LAASGIFLKHQEMTTMTIEQQIDELRLELRNACDAAERRQIAAELELAQAELAVVTAEQEGLVDAEPPF